MRVLLVSTYELGRQPFGLASPAAWLREAGAEVECLDLAVEELDEDVVRRADLIGLYLPMYTATRIALALLPRLRRLNPDADLCAFGLYAPVCRDELVEHGVALVVGGEFEARLAAHVADMVDGNGDPRSAAEGGAARHLPGPTATGSTTDGSDIRRHVTLEKLRFRPPDRGGLPPLAAYARLCFPDGTERVVGATEASRGCKHRCRHCPVVPVYEGAFRVVQREVVLADVAGLVAAGAEHVTFGDPDFLNGPTHAVRLVRELHDRFPELSYDVTVKIEHLLAHADLLPLLRDTGCVLVTSAVESVDDATLRILDKGHTREDLRRAVELCRAADLSLQPTFVAFHPWTSLDGYADLLETIAGLDLVGQVTPVQLAIRLLIPRASRLLELSGVRGLVGAHDTDALGHPWEHPDPRVDALQRTVESLVESAAAAGEGRGRIFRRVWDVTRRTLGETGRLGDPPDVPDRATIPYLTEPWYC